MKKGIRKKIFAKGEFVGNNEICFMGNSIPKRSKKGKAIRIAKFKCHCGNEFESRIDNVSYNRTKSCGCKTRELLGLSSRKHGLYMTPLYKVWIAIKSRLFNKKDKSYRIYGGRGIDMFSPWKEDFQLFYDYVSSLPDFKTKGYTLDRINNNGDYTLGNLRWTTRHIQSTNRRPKKPSISGYTDVYKVSPRGDKWYVSISINNKRHVLRGFRTIKDAVNARDEFIANNNLLEYKNIIV